jgi:DNA-binding MarR family transcriptional regulator
MSNRLDHMMQLEQTFRHVLRTIRKDLAGVFGETINGAEFGVLKLLVTKSPRIVTEIAHEFDVSVSHITHVVDQLVKKKLVERKRSRLDKRVVELHITDDGRKLAEEISRKKLDYFRRKFESFSDEEIAALHNLLKKLT